VREIWGKALKEDVKAMGGTLIVRPDSGDPTVVPIDAIDMLGESFGYTTNAKGYRVLHPSVRVIQGDGITPDSIKIILERMMRKGWSAENIAFGMGAGLLQKLTRDTLRFAMKANARLDDDDHWTGVNKDPKTDPGKASKRDRQAVVLDRGELDAVSLEDLGGRKNWLQPVWKNGELLVDWTLAEVRERAAQGLVHG
jgi:nicotinamide phosphoribosyltransferase